MRLAPNLDGDQVERGIEPDDELAPLPLDSLGDPVAERRHGHRGRRVELLRHSAGAYSAHWSDEGPP